MCSEVCVCCFFCCCPLFFFSFELAPIQKQKNNAVFWNTWSPCQGTNANADGQCSRYQFPCRAARIFLPAKATDSAVVDLMILPWDLRFSWEFCEIPLVDYLLVTIVLSSWGSDIHLQGLGRRIITGAVIACEGQNHCFSVSDPRSLELLLLIDWLIFQDFFFFTTCANILLRAWATSSHYLSRHVWIWGRTQHRLKLHT